MKYVYSIALVSILMSKTIYSVFWQVNFVVHQKEITELECINKDRPQMNCNGNCYLSKQLQKADLELDQKKEENSKRLSQIKSINDGDLFFAMSSLFSIELILNDEYILLKEYINQYSFNFISEYLRPPCRN
jgi:hypothetical protein